MASTSTQVVPVPSSQSVKGKQKSGHADVTSNPYGNLPLAAIPQIRAAQKHLLDHVASATDIKLLANVKENLSLAAPGLSSYAYVSTTTVFLH